MRFQFLALFAQLGDALVEFLLDGVQRAFHALGAGDIVRSREDMHLTDMVDDVPGNRVEGGDPVDFVAEELDADGQLFIHGDDLHGIAAHAEGAAREGDVVALVLHVNEFAQQRVTIDLLTLFQEQHATRVFLGSTQAVNARHRSDDHAIATGEQVRGGGVAQTLDVVVDIGILLDVGVRLRDVSLRLVIVVVGHEVTHGVVGHELAEFGAQLRRQGLVRLENQGRPLQFLDKPSDGCGFTGAGRTHEHDIVLAIVDPLGELLDGLGLIPRRLVGGLDDKWLVCAFDGNAHIVLPLSPA